MGTGREPRHWLLVASDRRVGPRRYWAMDLFQQRVRDRFWGFGGHTPNRKRVQLGDRAIVYVGGRKGGQAVADCVLASPAVTLSSAEQLRLSHGEAAFFVEQGVYLAELRVWVEPVRFTPEVVAELSFVWNKQRWGSALQGTLIPLPPGDYARLLQRARIQGKVAAASAAAAEHAETIAGLALAVSRDALFLGYGLADHEPVFWDPMAEKNPHLLAVGMTGSGKTETLRALVWELGCRQLPTLIFDLHGEFSGVATQTVDLTRVKLNPLELLGRSPLAVVYEVAKILGRIYGLGDQQEALLRRALKQSFAAKQIAARDPRTWENPPPTFGELRQVLEQVSGERGRGVIAARLLSRIEPLFDLEVFAEQTHLPFAELVRQTTALRLGGFPTDEVKTAVSDFVLRRLWYYLLGLGLEERLRFFVVLDEAHRLAYEGSALEPFLREARKYGVGVFLASQRPMDFGETVLANVASVVCFQCMLERDARYMALHINSRTEEIKALGRRGEALLKSASSPVPRGLQIVPLAQREAVPVATAGAA